MSYRGKALSAFGMAVAAIGMMGLGTSISAFAQQKDWTGRYVGAHLGIDFNKFDGLFPGTSSFPSSLSFIDLDDISCSLGGDASRAGLIGGLLAGWNIFQRNEFVGGLEADVSWTTADGDSSSDCSARGQDGRRVAQIDELRETSVDIAWKATLRARAGRLIANDTLVYVTAGIAFAEVDVRHSVRRTSSSTGSATTTTPVQSASTSDIRVGGVVGLGVEWQYSKDISTRIEGMYYDFGSKSYSLNNTRIDTDMSETVLRIGLTVNLD